VRTGVEDELKSFELGAIDYLTKPFNTSVLLARIEANLKKSGKEPIEAGKKQMPEGKDPADMIEIPEDKQE
jgi:DNA-binding response OmpR family regulator